MAPGSALRMVSSEARFEVQRPREIRRPSDPYPSWLRTDAPGRAFRGARAVRGAGRRATDPGSPCARSSSAPRACTGAARPAPNSNGAAAREPGRAHYARSMNTTRTSIALRTRRSLACALLLGLANCAAFERQAMRANEHAKAGSRADWKDVSIAGIPAEQYLGARTALLFGGADEFVVEQTSNGRSGCPFSNGKPAERVTGAAACAVDARGCVQHTRVVSHRYRNHVEQHARGLRNPPPLAWPCTACRGQRRRRHAGDHRAPAVA